MPPIPLDVEELELEELEFEELELMAPPTPAPPALDVVMPEPLDVTTGT